MKVFEIPVICGRRHKQNVKNTSWEARMGLSRSQRSEAKKLRQKRKTPPFYRIACNVCSACKEEDEKEKKRQAEEEKGAKRLK